MALIVSILVKHLICFSRRLNELAAWEEDVAIDEEEEEEEEAYIDMSMTKLCAGPQPGF